MRVAGIITNPTAPSATVHLRARLDESIHHLSVTAFRNQNDSSGKVKLQFCRDGSTIKDEVGGTSGQTEPLLYPLLRPYGEKGWDSDLTKWGLNIPAYVTSMLLMPEMTPLEDWGSDRREGASVDPFLKILKWFNHDVSKRLPTNRFQLSARLKQYWLVDTFSR